METIPAPPALCPQCHQPVPPAAYFCPNCGKKLSEPPLATGGGTQAWIYVFSIILPMIAFLAIKYWPGIKYVRSGDRRAKQIGFIAIALITVSTIVTFWLAAVWINQILQTSLNGIGNFGGY